MTNAEYYKKIRMVRPEVRELKDIVQIVMQQLSVHEESMRRGPKTHTVFQMSFYKFLKRLRDGEKIAPAEVMTVIIQHPELSSFIFRQKYADFTNALRQLSQTDASRQITYVTLFYDYYHRYHSFTRAAVKAGHYRLDKFSKQFVHDTFTQFPFLRKQSHLNHVISLLDAQRYACLITKHGISEVYDG